MEKYFKKVDGKYINIVTHTLEQLDKYPNLQVYIATDSQDEGLNTVFATTIVYRYGTRGAHYVVFKERVKRVKTMYMRLYDEAVRTIAAATILREELPALRIEALEFDYNHLEQFNSHPLINQIKGWVIGLDYKPVFKDGQMIASKAADHECRRLNNLFNLEMALKEVA